MQMAASNMSNEWVSISVQRGPDIIKKMHQAISSSRKDQKKLEKYNFYFYYTCGLDRKYRVFVSVVCLSVCLSVCKHANSKNKWSRILKFEYIVGYEKSSDEIDLGH